jgi:peptidoglycan-N-acetylglucosamine deacetylase
MLDFKTATLLLFLSMIIIALSGLFLSIPIWPFLIPLSLYIILVIHGSASVQSEFFMPVVCRGDEAVNEVAITFDDGPDPDNTQRILDTLKKNEVSAAFFCIGEKVAENPELMQQIADGGHVIGNHSYSHGFFFDLSSHDNMVREIRSTNKIIEKSVRKRIHLFRPPYGVTTPVLAKAVKKTKMTSVGWSLRSMDTVEKDPQKLVNKISKQVKSGDVILLHDTQAVTADALQSIIDNINSKGFKIVPVDKLLNINAYV